MSNGAPKIEEIGELIRGLSNNIPEEVPILVMDNYVVFPFMIAPILITDDANRKMIENVLHGNRMLGLFARHEIKKEAEKSRQIYNVGTISSILKMVKMPDGSMRVLVNGLKRVQVTETIQELPYLKVKIEVLGEIVTEDKKLEAIIKSAQALFEKLIHLSTLPEDLAVAAVNLNEPGKLADLIASNLSIKVSEQQEILEELDIRKRLELVLRLLDREIEILELGRKIQTQVKAEMDKSQRTYYLREQLRQIKKELGEEEEHPDLADLRKQLSDKVLPDHAREVAAKELSRLESMHPSSAEYTVSRTYLDWILMLPWDEGTVDNIDIAKAKRILNEDHYNLDKVKERILEYLSVIKLKQDLKGPILCFVGPPGVGKTSLGRSIARALKRKFYRMSLGGMRDEAEIRGHRRTYIGALPGRVIKGLKDCKSNNPVMMLDEVDKLGMDFRGDPASALLEVLDPEQNFSFTDHYLDMPFDLSKVMFITTANLLDPIPPALRDRMEVLTLSGYCLKEKMAIARKYLIPRQIEQNGLDSKSVAFTDASLYRIIEGYTREAGLRNLEREIGSVCRKIARRIAEGNGKVFRVSKRNVEEFLGTPKFYKDYAMRMGQPGIAIALAWTSVGGEMLFIEATATPGSGKLILTGQLGDVMKESAQAALTFIHSRAKKLNIPEEKFSKTDVHVHVPEGSTPKDGPSAGITICSALASLLTETPVKDFLAMTGEITLKGNVLPIGGVKEKILAAHRAGIKQVLLPSRNKRDLDNVSKDVLKQVDIQFVDKMDDVIKLALKNNNK